MSFCPDPGSSSQGFMLRVQKERIKREKGCPSLQAPVHDRARKEKRSNWKHPNFSDSSCVRGEDGGVCERPTRVLTLVRI